MQVNGGALHQALRGYAGLEGAVQPLHAGSPLFPVTVHA